MLRPSFFKVLPTGFYHCRTIDRMGFIQVFHLLNPSPKSRVFVTEMGTFDG